MTKQEILNKLVPYYEECIREIEGMEYEEAKSYVINKKLSQGICRTSEKVFGERIIGEKWVNERNMRGDNYWYSIPHSATTKARILDRLQKRVDIMKEILEEG